MNNFWNKQFKENAQHLIDALTPMDVINGQKVRIGGSFDGGYIMLTPKEYADNSGIAYSFGISYHSQWDLDMVEKGYHVFQYDGTIQNPPDKHEQLHFYRNNITGHSIHSDNERTISDIIQEHNHQEKDVILQMDIEGAEWDALESISTEDILHFEQLIIEFHSLTFKNQDEFERQIKILEKLNATHQVIHIHGNNCSPSVPIWNYLEQKNILILPTVLEVSYVRKRDYKFTSCNLDFPTTLDMPNRPDWDDIYIGNFHSGTITDIKKSELIVKWLEHQTLRHDFINSRFFQKNERLEEKINYIEQNLRRKKLHSRVLSRIKRFFKLS